MRHLCRPDFAISAQGQAKRGGKHCPFGLCALPLASFTTERAMTSIFQIALMILDVAKWFILAHIIMSWLINFQVLNLRQPFVASVWRGLNGLLEPIYSRVRSVMPNLGGIDLAPLVVLLAVYALRIVLINNIGLFY
jgi:YggT family protein